MLLNGRCSRWGSSTFQVCQVSIPILCSLIAPARSTLSISIFRFYSNIFRFYNVVLYSRSQTQKYVCPACLSESLVPEVFDANAAGWASPTVLIGRPQPSALHSMHCPRTPIAHSLPFCPFPKSAWQSCKVAEFASMSSNIHLKTSRPTASSFANIHDSLPKESLPNCWSNLQGCGCTSMETPMVTDWSKDPGNMEMELDHMMLPGYQQPLPNDVYAGMHFTPDSGMFASNISLAALAGPNLDMHQDLNMLLPNQFDVDQGRYQMNDSNGMCKSYFSTKIVDSGT